MSACGDGKSTTASCTAELTGHRKKGQREMVLERHPAHSFSKDFTPRMNTTISSIRGEYTIVFISLKVQNVRAHGINKVL